MTDLNSFSPRIRAFTYLQFAYGTYFLHFLFCFVHPLPGISIPFHFIGDSLLSLRTDTLRSLIISFYLLHGPHQSYIFNLISHCGNLCVCNTFLCFL